MRLLDGRMLKSVQLLLLRCSIFIVLVNLLVLILALVLVIVIISFFIPSYSHPHPVIILNLILVFVLVVIFVPALSVILFTPHLTCIQTLGGLIVLMLVRVAGSFSRSHFPNDRDHDMTAKDVIQTPGLLQQSHSAFLISVRSNIIIALYHPLVLSCQDVSVSHASPIVPDDPPGLFRP